ncbi:MAG: VacB/RNase II family 3'-5' exoribonuclease [Gammaproteobacteria bacterium]|nr:VacB/RNase II family 3'-5' exoribonuclease [Gammaproteobacteria bacterium]
MLRRRHSQRHAPGRKAGHPRNAPPGGGSRNRAGGGASPPRPERIVSAFLATTQLAGRDLYVHGAERKLNLRCAVPPEHRGGARGGEWVIARLLKAPALGQAGLARIEKILDPARSVELATEAAIARYNLPVEFSSDALREAHAFGHVIDPAEAMRRADLRSLPLVTIDGEDARDFDDAVYAEAQPGGGFRLVVAIADVSHYVRPGTALDEAARARGTSVYFPTRVLPMLPTALSNHLCSLEPDVDRLCMVADMQLTSRGALKAWRFYPAVMRSAARLTYDAACAMLFRRVAAARAGRGALLQRLEPLLGVYAALARHRHQRGALDFDAPEAEFVIDAGQHVHSVIFHHRNDAHRLIEECMIVANVAAARELKKRRVPGLMRVHSAPEERKRTQLLATLRVLGIEPQIPDEPRTRDYAAIVGQLKDPGAKPFVESLIVRSMAQALYQPQQVGHFGLALDDYAHFTSPIRRYPDLMVHRALRVALGLLPPDSQPRGAALEQAGLELSQLERRADESDRYVSTFLKCVYLRERTGQEFAGLVTTVVEFGCFVQLLDVGVDGLLHLAALNDDEYQLSRDATQWVGRRRKRRFAPGTRLAVIVTGVRPAEGMVDLELADGP